MNIKLKIGYVATSQLSFPGPKDMEMKRSIKCMKENAAEMNFEFIPYEKMVITPAEAAEAVGYLEEKKVDFLLINTVSFSAGALIPILAKIKEAKIGLWGIPEGVNTGVVPLNSFCGINMYMSIIKRYLKDFEMKCKWFFGYGDDAQFKVRLKTTVTALTVLKKLKNARIALVGGIAPGFHDLYFDERNINSLLDGIFVNRLHEFSEISELAEKMPQKEVEKISAKILSDSKGCNPKSQNLIELSAKLYLAYKAFCADFGYDALALSCWPKFQDLYKYSVCSVVAMLNDDKIATSCEGDLPSAINMLALQEMANESSMLMDLSAFDTKDDSVLMWHCGPASCRYCQKNGYSLSVNYHGMPHIPGQGVNSCGVTRDMEFDAQRVTSFRFSDDFTKFMLLEGDFMGTQKESVYGSRGWLGNLKLNGTPIGAQDFINTVLVSGFEHHFPIVSGAWSDSVLELAAWLNISPIEAVSYKDYLQ